jgi:metallo-beta-lactamase class B
MFVRAIFALLMLAPALLPAAVDPKSNQPFPPHKIIGNIYYVGTNNLASYLIVTDRGNILINPDYEESIPLIQASVEKLGFRMADIKIILISHAHDDHVAGTARMKEITGAKLMVMEGDVAEMEDGGASDFHYRDYHWRPAKVDRVLKDNDEVRLGGVTLTAHLTPGHTKGCTTWTTTVLEGRRSYNVVIVGSPNVNPGYKLVGNERYPNIVADYERGFRVLKGLPCDVFLGAHGGYYGLDEKYAKLKAGGSNPFIDPQGYREYIADRERAFRAELKKQGG